MPRSKNQAQPEKTQEQYIAELEAYSEQLKQLVDQQQLAKVSTAFRWQDVVPWLLVAVVAAVLFFKKSGDSTDINQPKPIPSNWQLVEDYYPKIIERHKASFKEVASAIRSQSIKTDEELYIALTEKLTANRKPLDESLDVLLHDGLLRNDDGSFNGDKNFIEPAAKFLETLAEKL